MDAIEAYDPERGVKFETYSLPRIKGSILDELRSMDWVPRLIRIRKHQLARATQALEASLGRKPTEREIAKELNMNMEEFNRLKQDANSDSQVSPNTKHSNIEAQKRNLKNLLTKGLTRAERLIVVLYYYDEMTMKEIGTTLGLSESRVSQMHASIIARLKAQMGKPREPGKEWSTDGLQQPRKQHYLFAHHKLRDLFFNTPEVVIDRLRNDKGRVFLLKTWDKAGKDLGALNLVAPRGLHHEIRMYDDNTTVVLIKLPIPKVLSEAYFAALIYRPKKNKQKAIKRFILLEYSVPFGYGNLSSVLHKWTVEGVHKNIGYGCEPTLEDFYAAVCNLL